MMTKLTTPKAVLIGFVLIALSIASLPYTIKPANAELYSYSFQGIENSLNGIARSLDGIARKM
jgi:hypothetical protein